ncbi:MAG: helix-turn-helix domain-containing protein [Bdellovibrionales bacterium]|nr:helix-turn-helix domain-containing protein [Bdellovibrionales bacterium]
MSISLNNQNFYELLDVASTATQDEIHRAYQKAKQTYAPNSPALYTMFTPEEAREIALMLEEAFATLSSHEARKRYDLKLLKLRNNDEPNSALYSETLPDVSLDKDGQDPGLYSSPEEEPTSKVPKEVPDGYAQTPLSVYKIDHKMEENIKHSEVFDGSFIKSVREYKKVELHDLSEKTRISTAYINAIEANDFKALPAAVFSRGFINQISKILGLDAEKASKSYMDLFKNKRS